jgi:hypothetical protein
MGKLTMSPAAVRIIAEAVQGSMDLARQQARNAQALAAMVDPGMLSALEREQYDFAVRTAAVVLNSLPDTQALQ